MNIKIARWVSVLLLLFMLPVMSGCQLLSKEKPVKDSVEKVELVSEQENFESTDTQETPGNTNAQLNIESTTVQGVVEIIGIPETQQGTDISDEEFYKYIKDNLTISTSFPYDKEKEKGVFSALVDDFDNNGCKEMLTFSITHNEADQAYVVLDLYTVKDNAIVLSDTSKEIFASGTGNYQNSMCGFLEDSAVRIQYDYLGYGGNTYGKTYMTFKVTGDKLVMCNEYALYESYIYDFYEYKETVSNKAYASIEDFSFAIADNGFDSSAHNHVGVEDAEFIAKADDYKTAKCFKGNHIFSLFNSDTLLVSGRYGFIHDNTGLSNNLK